jgi:two-component sensor histidine kinase
MDSQNEDSRYYTSIALSEDTLSWSERIMQTKEVLARMDTSAEKRVSRYYIYFRGHAFELSGNRDSALYYYHQLEGDTSDIDLFTLVQNGLLNTEVREGEVIGIEKVKNLMRAIKIAETKKSLFLYRVYESAAKSYYTQRNPKLSLEYSRLYFTHHPLNVHPVIRQHYYDICFMLAAALDHKEAMRYNLDSARQLAMEIGDTIAFARTYDYEAQLYAIDDPEKAVACSRKFFQLLKAHASLHPYVFNNLATSFEGNGQVDSAVYYYRKAIQWAERHPGVNLQTEYESLAGIYKKTGRYKEATHALDSAFAIYRRTTEYIQADKIEEIRAQYQSEKKDQAIAALQSTSLLSRKIIMQQRWFFAGGLFTCLIAGLYLYNGYRRKLLIEKNEKLSIENKRLKLEQKTLQLQLNPHFIYNCIANLQGLISIGQKAEASTYLSSFSQLMRSVLELNREEYILLREEIETLEHYIRLQQMRFANVFEYRVETGGVDIDEVLIPPMLVQPLVENAIEHGFMNMTEGGMLLVMFSSTEQHLQISVTDNGIGKAKTGSPPKKSLSQSITRERLDLLFNRRRPIAHLHSQPNPEPQKGYGVNISIPLIHA